MSTKYNFTKSFISSLKSAKQGKRDYYKDSKVLGLEIMVTDKDNKSFKVTRKKNGRIIRVTLGKYPDLTIENARKQAFEINSQISQGINPNDEKGKLNQEITFGQLFEEYLERYSKKQKTTWREEERDVKRFCSNWFKRKISTVTNQEIRLLHEKIGNDQGKIYMANRMLERIRAIYNKASEWGYSGENPTNKIKKFKEQSRDRFIGPDELPRFFDSLKQEENEVARDYIYISLYTGARQSNILSMKWDQINFTTKEWRIPKTKNGEPQTIPLIEEAIKILKQRKKDNKELELKDFQKNWVFPSRTSASGHLEEPKKAWQRILKRAEIKDLRIHDIRRTFGSIQIMTGSSSDIVGKSLGHKSIHATKIYARMNLDPVRQSMEKAADFMRNFESQN